MANNAEIPLGHFPPTLFICPTIDPSEGRITMRSQKPLEQLFLRPRRRPLLQKLNITPDTVGVDLFHRLLNGDLEPETLSKLSPPYVSTAGRLRRNEEQIRAELDALRKTRSTDWLPPPLAESYVSRMSALVQLLEDEGSKLPDLSERLGWSPGTRRSRTKKIISQAFPALAALSPEIAKRIFKTETTDTLADYIDTVAVPNAFDFWDWCTNQLPEDLRKKFELSQRVRDAKSFIDLLSVFGRDSDTIEIREGKRKGVVYADRDKWEAYIMLLLANNATLADLSRDPLEEDLLTLFHDRLCEFKEEEGWFLLVDRDKETAECVRRRLASTKDRTQLEAENARYGQEIPLFVRRFGSEDYNVFILQKRRKGLFERMLKYWRDRPYPLADLLGARCIFPNNYQLKRFISMLQTRLADEWIIEEDKEVTHSPQSALTKNVKYVCRLKAHPDCPIELQVPCYAEYMKPGAGEIWTIEYEPDTFPPAYKVKQLGEMFAALAPKELYGINWESDEVKRKLLQHANLSLFE